MQKRRPFAKIHSYLLENSQRSQRNHSLFTKSKSQCELKRHRLQGDGKNSKQKKSITLKNDDFDSLESLFDLKKPLTLPEIHSPLLNNYPTTEKFINLSFDCSSLRPLFLNKCISTSELEPNIIPKV